MVDVVADRLQGNAEKNFHHMVFPVTRGKELLNGLRFRIAAFADQFSHQAHESIELGVWNGHVVTNSCVVMLRVSFPFCTSFRVPQKALDVFGRRKDEVFLDLKALLAPFGIERYFTDGWGAYPRHRIVDSSDVIAQLLGAPSGAPRRRPSLARELFSNPPPSGIYTVAQCD